MRLAVGPIMLTGCAELNGDCPSRVTRIMKSGLSPHPRLELRLAGRFERFLSGNVPTNPSILALVYHAVIAPRTKEFRMKWQFPSPPIVPEPQEVGSSALEYIEKW